MKYCLDCMCDKEYLAQADEIFIRSQHNRLLTNILEDYPKANVIVDYDDEIFLPWDFLTAANETHNGRLIICHSSPTELIDARNHGIKCFYKYAVASYYDLRALADIGVCYVYLQPPLFFDLDNVKTIGIPIRAIPNVAFDSFQLPYTNGAHGTWIRPEDIKYYEDYIDVCEFRLWGQDRKIREQTLFDIYKKQFWPEDLGIIITNLGQSVDNKYVAQERLMPLRLNCRQTCELNGHCHICERALDFGITVHKYHDNLKETELS